VGLDLLLEGLDLGAVRAEPVALQEGDVPLVERGRCVLLLLLG